MSLIKIGENTALTENNLHSAKEVLCDPNILQNFKKFAAELKMIAPKADDFLYFSAIMMHAAEASLLDDEGKIRKDAEGNDVTAEWVKKGESIMWKCSDKSIKPFKNCNGDIFPAVELIKAHKKWVGRPLCLDHKSSSVDMVRGIIVDTYYDYPNQRVIALCALDKVNYPDLARKVSTGYATSVSMGTAVGKAICSDCGTVARVESEFCKCMRNKSCYGEVNVDLSPIELSIVVNGADPKAKIRHIVAAANNLARYIDAKQEQFSKIGKAEAEDETKDIELAGKIESGLEKAIEDFTKLKELISELKGNEETEQEKFESGASESDEDESDSVDDSDKTEFKKKDEDNLYPKQAFEALEGIKKSLASLTKDFNNFVMKNNKEITMKNKNAYFQGGGGVNEPTPGQPKYEKEDADRIRNTEDKQMIVSDMGSVDGLHPGNGSESDLDRKKRLLRASDAKSEIALRREAAVARAKRNLQTRKEAYFQGGGGVNEPTPGKPKYPKEDAETVRNTQDKQMVGKAPFPGVGDINGLYGDDKKVKQMLSRAKLNLKFVKAAKPTGEQDFGESRWNVYADEKLILTATVNEITGGKVAALYDSVATKEFGQKILQTIKTEGFSKAASLFKSAAPPAPVMPPMAPATPAAPAAPAAPATTTAPAAPEGLGDAGLGPVDDTSPVDGGGSGDQSENVQQTLDLLENNIADLRKGVEALVGQSGNELDSLESFDNLTPVNDELGLADPAMSTASSVAQLNSLRKKIAKELVVNMRETINNMKNSHKELTMSREIYKKLAKSNDKITKQANVKKVNAIVKSTIKESNAAIADSKLLMGTFSNYAGGTYRLLKMAKQENKMRKIAQDPTQGVPGRVYEEGDPMMPLDAIPGVPYRPTLPPSSRTAPTPAAAPTKSTPSPAPRLVDDKGMPAPYGHKFRDYLANVVEQTGRNPNSQSNRLNPETGLRGPDASNADDENFAKVKKPDGTEITLEKDEVESALSSKAEFNMNTKSGRAQWRAKLAEKGITFSDLIQKAHPKGGTTTQLDHKPTGDLAKVETITETHKAMLDLANAPPKVRKEAEMIQKLIVAGKLNESELPSLIAKGVDPEAVKYWKQYWGEAKDGGAEFGSELTKEYQTAKKAELEEAFTIKTARSYDLAYKMAANGMIGNDSNAISQQVKELMSLDDNGFASIKRMAERTLTVKNASFPQVFGGNEITVSDAPKKAEASLNLDTLFLGRKY